MKPRGITRDNKWGIPAPFPGSEGKTIYVWLEAVLGYVSASIEWAEKTGKPEAWKDFWFTQGTRNVHFIGKDNIPFHVIIFPALLQATHDPYIQPWQVSSTEFILFDGKKFSKSKKIGVWIDEALKVAPAEYWRYVLIAIRPETRDANFTWHEFETHVNAELNDVLGNFVHRTLTFVNNQFDSTIPQPGELDERDEAIKNEIEQASRKISELLDHFQLRSGLAAAIELARKGNQYLSEREPWHLIKTDRTKTATTLYLAAQLVATLEILIAPFLPETSLRIREQLNLGDGTPEKWSNAETLRLQVGHRIGKAIPLFHKVKVPQT